MHEQYLPHDRGTVVLHWFTGSKSEARRAAMLGCYFSVNAEMTRSDRGRALRGLPTEGVRRRPWPRQGGRLSPGDRA
ncbi:TatD family hydrolase [Mesorhizobium sp. ORM6]